MCMLDLFFTLTYLNVTYMIITVCMEVACNTPMGKQQHPIPLSSVVLKLFSIMKKKFSQVPPDQRKNNVYNPSLNSWQSNFNIMQ